MFTAMDWQFAAVDSQHPCKQRVPDDLSQETVSTSLFKVMVLN